MASKIVERTFLRMDGTQSIFVSRLKIMMNHYEKSSVVYLPSGYVYGNVKYELADTRVVLRFPVSFRLRYHCKENK